MISAALNSVVKAGVKATLSKDNFEDVKPSANEVVVAVVVLLVFVVVTLLIGKWLWNNVLCKYVTVVKPVDSVWTLLLVMVAIDWFFNNKAVSY
tara:strand:- start:1819 stop:2100 length:282 start_codon:yes stop_codon:yes gene_type:complete